MSQNKNGTSAGIDTDTVTIVSADVKLAMPDDLSVQKSKLLSEINKRIEISMREVAYCNIDIVANLDVSEMQRARMQERDWAIYVIDLVECKNKEVVTALREIAAGEVLPSEPIVEAGVILPENE